MLRLPCEPTSSRVLSRDGSFVTSKPGQDPFRSEQDEDLEQTPPGTPRVGAPGGEGSVPTSPRTAHANLASNIRDTPPGTPATTSRPLAGPETNKVKEMRERVQEMTTDEAELTNGSGNVSSSASVSAPSPPAQDVQEQIADLPESAAAAESEPEFRHQDGDVVIQEPEELPETPATAMPPPSSSTSRLPALTAPAIAALGRSSSLIPPPSPASSVRAETGSNAGDSDYLNNDFPVSARGGPSRMSSMSSMRSVTYSGGSLFHSALPRSSTGPETPSDALSDVSTDVAPPETPRPPVDAVDASTPSTPLLPSATAISRGPSAEVPPPYEPAEEASSSVQSARPQPTQSTPAKSFVNSFSSLGSSTSSPFASSSSSAFGAAANSKSSAFGSSSASSNLSTAKPIGGSGFGAFGGAGTASPFASGAGKTNALTRKGSEAVAAQEEDDAADENDVATKEGLERDENKIFSSSEEVTMVTGEEDEYTQYAVPRAKLFVMDGAEWKERGVGQLRLNTRNDPRDDKFSVRMGKRLLPRKWIKADRIRRSHALRSCAPPNIEYSAVLEYAGHSGARQVHPLLGL